MLEPIGITGVGTVSPLGLSLDELAHSLEQGTLVTGRDTPAVDDLARVPARRARRLSLLALRLCAAARGALEGSDPPPPDRTAIVIGTGLGPLETTVDFMAGYLERGAAEANPSLFPTSILHEPAAELSIELGLRGPALTVTARELSMHAAIDAAARLLRLGRADVALAGCCDARGPSLQAAIDRLGLRSKGGVARPFDHNRDGMMPGEGAIVLRLERTRAAGSEIAGLGLASQATTATRQALARAGIAASEVDYVALSGNGSRRRDADEAALLGRIFGPRPVAASSILGQVGDSYAAGGLRVAQAVVALEQGLLAGTSGFSLEDPDARVPGLVVRARRAVPRTVLVPAFCRTGGGALLLRRP